MSASVEHPLLAGAEIVFRVSVATAHLSLVLEAVGQLDRELTLVRGHADALAPDPLAVAEHAAVANLRRMLSQALSTIRGLRERVLDTAGPEATLEQKESALRARTVVVLMQLAELKHAEDDVTRRAALFAGRFETVVDVATSVLDAIGRINEEWLEARRSAEAQQHESCDERTARLALYQAALGNAERAFTAIGTDPDLSAFLRGGASIASERFQSACRVIAMLLEVPLVPLTKRSPAPTPIARRLDPRLATFASAARRPSTEES